MIPLGEFPELPPALLVALHQRTAGARHAIADALWAVAADGAVGMFESYRSGKARGTFG